MQQTHQAQFVANLNNFVIALVNYLGFSNLASARRFFHAKFDAPIFRTPSYFCKDLANWIKIGT